MDVRSLEVTARRGNEIVATGSSAAVGGSPVNTVVWLANALARYGGALDAGHLVLSGACTPAFPVAPGDEVRADFAALGRITIGFA